MLVGDLLDGTPATLVMHDAVIRDNTLGSLSTGGGVANNGQLELNDAVVQSNRASRGGGIFAGLDAVSTFSTVTVSDNTASDDGGGVFLAVRSLSTVSGATAARNTAAFDGGGCGTAATSPSPTAPSTTTAVVAGAAGSTTTTTPRRQSRSAALAPTAPTLAGGAYNQSDTLAVDRSTLDHNDASGFGGGGLNNNNGSTTLSNSTVSGNTSAFWGGRGPEQQRDGQRQLRDHR